MNFDFHDVLITNIHKHSPTDYGVKFIEIHELESEHGEASDIVNIEFTESEVQFLSIGRFAEGNLDNIKIHSLNIHDCFFDEALSIIEFESFESTDLD